MLLNKLSIRRERLSKIMATIGPSSNTDSTIEQLFVKGVDVFRLNFSHSTHQEHERIFHSIRSLEKKYQTPTCILADLQGPKFRISLFENDGIFLKEGDIFCFDQDATLGNQKRTFLPHPQLFDFLAIGDIILLSDGKIKTQILNLDSERIIVEVMIGGYLSGRQGINILSQNKISTSILTDKDEKDLEFALSLGVDWIAFSFVQTPDDIRFFQKKIKGRALLASKIEKPLAITHLFEIVQMSDCILIARGDLGVEMSLESIPCLQKEIIKTCRNLGKPVIVATQMLESMIKSKVPTRAEVSDVATAIFEGADGVCLSGESARGNYPIEAVIMMDKIIVRTEADPLYAQELKRLIQQPLKTVSDSISASAEMIVRTILSPLIVNFTETGYSTIRLSRERPLCPILSLTQNLKVARQMQLVWGVFSKTVKEIKSIDEMVHLSCQLSFEMRLTEESHQIIITAGIPFGQSGDTNCLRIAKVGNFLIK
jgi:pyruvate kinase